MLSCSDNALKNKLEPKLAVQTIAFDNYFQKISYAIGLDHGKAGVAFYSNAKLKGKFDLKAIEKGLVDYLNSEPLEIPSKAVDSILNLYLVEDGSVDSSKVSRSLGSYAIGVNEAIVLVSSFVDRHIENEIVPMTLVKGIQDGFNGVETNYSLEDAQFDLATYYADINKKVGEDFLNKNKENPIVFETASGLQYKIFENGTGVRPNTTDSVAVQYVGRFITGEEFESSLALEKPVRFSLFQVIKGWTEGLQLMREGAKYRFYIPYQLAYGENGGGPIEPFSALMFDIELVKVIKYTPNH